MLNSSRLNTFGDLRQVAMTMKNKRPTTMVITMVITMMARCVDRVKTKTPRKTQPKEMQSVIKVLSKITSCSEFFSCERFKIKVQKPRAMKPEPNSLTTFTFVTFVSLQKKKHQTTGYQPISNSHFSAFSASLMLQSLEACHAPLMEASAWLLKSWANKSVIPVVLVLFWKYVGMSQILEAYLPSKNFRMDLKGSPRVLNTETNLFMSSISEKHDAPRGVQL